VKINKYNTVVVTSSGWHGYPVCFHLPMAEVEVGKGGAPMMYSIFQEEAVIFRDELRYVKLY
jgi:hypothetical protein